MSKKGLYERTITKITYRRQRVEKGKINSIPLPHMPRVTRYMMPGLESETYYLLTAQKKGGKSQISSYLFIWMPILYAYKFNIKVKIFIVPLEETPEKVMARFISHLLYVIHGKKVDYRNLMSSYNKPVSDEVFRLINDEPIKSRCEFFERNVEFIGTDSPKGIIKKVENYFIKNGTIIYDEVESVDEDGVVTKDKFFSHYIPNDEDVFTFLIVDHISLLGTEGHSNSIKLAIDSFSRECIDLRNKYKLSPVIIQQQNDNDSAALKNQAAARPTSEGLRDSKQPSRDCNVFLGIYSPYTYQQQDCFGYDIRRLKDNFRLLECIVSRDGTPGVCIGMRFEGACSYIEELPNPNYQADKLEEKIREIENERLELDQRIQQELNFKQEEKHGTN